MTWKASLPCTRVEAEALTDDLPVFAERPDPPTLISSEPDPARPDEWLLEGYFETAPSETDLAVLLTLAPSANRDRLTVEVLEDQDWVTLSQQGLEPIRAGRFFVHTASAQATIPQDAIAFEIDAGRAFGTGHHETTTGCLAALDGLKREGAHFSNIVDVGTGTGLLAFAALRLWPTARVAASDIDPVSIEVTRENAVKNRIRLGRSRGEIELAVAPGLAHLRLRSRAPYDLIVANILAGPLINLAPSITAALRPGGRLILAGLLDGQADGVALAYHRKGMALVSSNARGEWPTLVMRRRRGVR
jgi:ribosomal protein L11 methyltransferase